MPSGAPARRDGPKLDLSKQRAQQRVAHDRVQGQTGVQ